MISHRALREAERAYVTAATGDSEPARLARRRIVEQAARDVDEYGARWTHRRIARELGKSAGWVGQLLNRTTTKGTP